VTTTGAPAASHDPLASRTAAPGRPGRWRGRSPRARREILLFLGLLFCYGFFRQNPVWNENSRYDLVRALVEDRSVVIDKYHENTGDKAFRDGHYYSDKAPGTALLGAPVYALLLAVHEATDAGPPGGSAAVHALTFAVCSVPTAVLVLLLLRFLRPAVGYRWALVVALAHGLGSIAFPFATMYFGHAASAAFLFTAFYLLWRYRSDRRDRLLVGAGLAVGAAVITEIPVALGGAVLAVYATWIARERVAWFVLGGVPVALVLLAYNWIAFGSPFSLGYQYATLFAERPADREPSPATARRSTRSPGDFAPRRAWRTGTPG
jgi:hypothetical protein